MAKLVYGAKFEKLSSTLSTLAFKIPTMCPLVDPADSGKGGDLLTESNIAQIASVIVFTCIIMGIIIALVVVAVYKRRAAGSGSRQNKKKHAANSNSEGGEAITGNDDDDDDSKNLVGADDVQIEVEIEGEEGGELQDAKPAVGATVLEQHTPVVRIEERVRGPDTLV